MLIRVTNCSGTGHKDRFSGVDYDFPADGETVIPAEAAMHIFGMGEKDRSKQITRLGWAPTRIEWDTAMRRLDSFMLEPVAEEESDVVVETIERRMERPTSGTQIDPDLAPIKARTKSILSKAS